MIVLSGIRQPLGSTDEQAAAAAKRMLGDPEGGSYHIRRVSYDMRRGRADRICSVICEFGSPERERELASLCPGARFEEKREFSPVLGTKKQEHRPVVVGSGPAGLFAAWLLSEYGYRPLLLERGAEMDARVSAVEGFFAGGDLDPSANVQFGEGGAGTFSDGKLTTRINDELCDLVLDTFIRFGAPEAIRTRQKPHIGTDLLRGVVKAIRGGIIANGGEVRFLSPVEDISAASGRIRGVRCAGQDIPADAVILACGHSARDTFAMLSRRGVSLTAKAFSVGVRIEHLQSRVDESLYGMLAGDPRLPRGEYSLSAKSGDRGVYTFCMCPGGYVVAAASEALGTVTNGMSNCARDGKNANSAGCVSVDSRDFGKDPFRAIAFQRELERAAYAAAGGGFAAPVSSVSRFLEGKGGFGEGRVRPSYPRDVRGFDLERVLGTGVCGCLRDGLRAFGTKMSCFRDGDALLTGVETRTSSPVRIERGEDRQAVGMKGLYPCGEGAGYAGGIMSAAVDGLRCAMAVMGEYAPF